LKSKAFQTRSASVFPSGGEEIEREIEKFEKRRSRKPTVREIALITRETRPAALKEIATSEVVAFERSQMSPEEWRQLQGLRCQAEAQTLPIQVGQERKALRASISHLFERSSVLREHEILAQALNQSLGSLDLEGLKTASSATVVRVDKKKVVVAPASRKEMVLDLRRPDSFDVARSRQIEVSTGDKILIGANHKRLGLTNGQVLTICVIAPDGALQTKEGLCVPGDFRQWCHGYVVASHKAQGWTADHVVVAAERLTSKGAYVACSRGRRSCIVHTPDKARLMERLPEGKRRAALDVLSEIHPKNVSIVNRVRAWKQLSIDLARSITPQLNQPSADGMRIVHPQIRLSQCI
jgi:hypothetical protein